MSAEILIKAATPAWLLNLAPTKRMEKVKIAYDELDVGFPSLSVSWHSG